MTKEELENFSLKSAIRESSLNICNISQLMSVNFYFVAQQTRLKTK